MPRLPRQLLDGGYYHVIARGNNRLFLLEDESDFLKFISIISQTKSQYSFKLHHYCILSNHVHLLVQVARGSELPRIMQKILFGYARYYKKQKGYVGHLWQGRYKSPLIDKESYLLECGRYIERNPARAGMVRNLVDYPWSSYLYYAFGRKDGLIEPNPCYEEMGANDEERRIKYQDFVKLENPYSRIIDGQLIESHF